MSEETKQPWDRTKWLLLIAVLMIVEGFVFYAAMENSNSTSALGYISFAGTVTSIILAVLAIIYGFIQNSSQERKSELITEQMSKIKDVVSDLDRSKESLDIGLEKFADLLNPIKESQIEVQNTVEKIESVLFKTENVSDLQNGLASHIKLILSVIYFASQKNILEVRSLKDYYVFILKKLIDDGKERLNKNDEEGVKAFYLMRGAFDATLELLVALRKFQVNDAGKMIIINNFSNNLKNAFNSLSDNDKNLLKKFDAEYDSPNPSP